MPGLQLMAHKMCHAISN
uniref:Uncharacterized protein n=1 Tax=Arundo donax TaxID=35708 RepID=A0A0A8YPF4_ARUDO